MAGKITIVLIDHSYLVRSGMENLLREFPEVSLTEVFDGSEKHLVEKTMSLKPDFIIINPKSIKDSLNSFVLSLGNDALLIGLVDEHTPPVIRSRFKHILTITDNKYDLLNNMHKLMGTNSKDKSGKHENHSLSERETTVLKHITQGMTNQEIAEKLFLSVHTVTTHRKNITKKLGIKTVSGLTVYALLNKIIDMGEVNQQ